MDHRGDQMFILGDLTRVAWHGKIEAKRLAGTLKRKWGLPPVSGNRKEKKLVVGQGSWQTEPKPVLRVEEDIKIFRIEEAIFFKPVLKIA